MAQETGPAEDRVFRSLLEELPVGIFVMKAGGDVFFTNRAARELLGKGVDPAAHVEGLARVYAAYRAGTSDLYETEALPIVMALNGIRTQVDDMEIHRPDGIVPIEVWGAPIYGESGMVEYAAAAFVDISERRRAQAELASHASTLDLMQQCASAANESSRVEEVLAAILKVLSVEGGWSAARGTLVDLPGREDPLSIWYFNAEGLAAGLEGTGLSALATEVLKSGRPSWVENLGSVWGCEVVSELVECGLVSGVACPVGSGVRRMGVVELYSLSPRPPNKAEMQGFAQVAVQLEHAAERIAATEWAREAHDEMSKVVAELERRNREAQAASELADVLHSANSRDDIYRAAAQFARALFMHERGSILVFGPSRNHMEEVARWGSDEAAMQVVDPEDCWAMRRGRPHVVEEGEGPRCAHVDSADAYMCIPLMAQAEILGVFHLRRPPVRDSAGVNPIERFRPIALTLAEHLSLALASLTMRETLRDQSIRDPLTGLYNRRFLEEALERELSRAARTSLSLSVVAIDIDHFKRFNDRFGHETGDIVLKEVGGFLERQVRKSDIACRFGGEEFVVVLPEADSLGAAGRAEVLRKGVRELTMPKWVESESLSISLGISSFPEHGADPGSLLRSADEALYRAKETGRDRAVVAGAARDGVDSHPH